MADLTSSLPCLQEEEQADYKHAFPDYHASFADILEASGDDMDIDGPSEGREAQQQQGATHAEAGSASAKQLMQGQLLGDIVLQHAR